MTLVWLVLLAGVAAAGWYLSRPQTDVRELADRVVSAVDADGALRRAVVQAVLGRATRRPGAESERLQLGVPLDVLVHQDDRRVVERELDRIDRAVRRVARQRRIDVGPGFRLERVVPAGTARPGQPWVAAAEPARPARTLHVADGRTVRRPPERPTVLDRPSAHLVLVGEPRVRLAVPAAGGTLGRDGDRCDILLDRPTVSRLHAELRPVPGGFLVTDRDSANGITIRGARTAQGRLASGDVLGLGRTVELTLEIDDA